ncbi:hypothetical protein DY058_000984 [Clostridium beijerinckii]|nr:hypothetical protein [Clostridium beijerinckii]
MKELLSCKIVAFGGNMSDIRELSFNDTNSSTKSLGEQTSERIVRLIIDND